MQTGAMYSVIPSKILERLRIERRSMRKMRLADGSVIERHLGDPEIEV